MLMSCGLVVVVVAHQIGVLLTVVFGFPLNVFPCRFTLDIMFWRHAKPSRNRVIAVTTVIV